MSIGSRLLCLELTAILRRGRWCGVAPRQRPELGVGVAEEKAGVLQHGEERRGVEPLGGSAPAALGLGEESVGVGRGDAGEWGREHTHQVAIVVGVGQRSQGVDGEADDVRRREVRRCAQFVGNAGGAERFFELPPVAADAAQHDGDVAGAVPCLGTVAASDEGGNLAHDRGCLVGGVLLAVSMHNRHVGIAALGYQLRRGEPVPVEEPIGAGEDGSEGAVVLAQLHAVATPLPLVFKERRQGAAEREDGLVGIADHGQPRVGAMVLHQLGDQLDLGCVDVLVFVDDHIAELLGELRAEGVVASRAGAGTGR